MALTKSAWVRSLGFCRPSVVRPFAPAMNRRAGVVTYPPRGQAEDVAARLADVEQQTHDIDRRLDRWRPLMREVGHTAIDRDIEDRTLKRGSALLTWLLCELLGWHTAQATRFDGASVVGTCQRCGGECQQNSHGQWFRTRRARTAINRVGTKE